MLEARLVKEIDSDKIFEWRNSPEVYRFLFNPTPIERSGHDQWLAKTLVNPLIAFYIVSNNGNDIGTVRFDFEVGHEKAEVGIYLAPEHQGKGLGNKMLEVCEIKVKSQFPKLKMIIARVLPENIASEKMFIKNGYSKKFIQLEKKYE